MNNVQPQFQFPNFNFGNFAKSRGIQENQQGMQGLRGPQGHWQAQGPQGLAQRHDISIFDMAQGNQNIGANQNPLGLVPEEQQLLELGVPLEVILEGDDAIMNFIQDNGITGYIEKPDASLSIKENNDNEFNLNPQQQEVLDLFIKKKVSEIDMEHVINALQNNDKGAVANIAKEYGVELP